mmetsp:Transcript_20972/g.33478  ORF Transcript_20972/g.33478 Transcript_20972/m.33478 type:complete len:209 (-) Transcript_20972:162-788(-)
MGNWCAMACCGDNANKRLEQPSSHTETTPFGQTGKTGSATKDAYAEKYGLTANKCIQGQCTTDDQLCEFLQQNIQIQGVQCLVVISSKPAHAYRLPTEEATETGISILSQMVLANVESLRVFHLNGQRLDWNRSPILSDAISQCQQLELVDLYDCMINNDSALVLFNAVKSIATLKEINFAKNDINAETREKIQDDLQQNYPNITVVF